MVGICPYGTPVATELHLFSIIWERKNTNGYISSIDDFLPLKIIGFRQWQSDMIFLFHIYFWTTYWEPRKSLVRGVSDAWMMSALLWRRGGQRANFAKNLNMAAILTFCHSFSTSTWLFFVLNAWSSHLHFIAASKMQPVFPSSQSRPSNNRIKLSYNCAKNLPNRNICLQPYVLDEALPHCNFLYKGCFSEIAAF